MTNYNKRLDEALKPIRDFAEDNAHSVTYEFSSNFDKDLKEDTEKVELLVVNAKQAITSLIKELVAEAKPGIHPYLDNKIDGGYAQAIYGAGVLNYQNNLLKELEEK